MIHDLQPGNVATLHIESDKSQEVKYKTNKSILKSKINDEESENWKMRKFNTRKIVMEN